MTNAPESRKTHITRIVGTNRDGERLDDIWVDVERMDGIKSASQLPSNQWQGVQRHLKWCDDPDSDDYSPEGTPSRLMVTVKICDPESEDVDDPDEWVPVRVIKGMRSKGSVDSMGQGFMDRFVIDNEDGENTARIVERRKISHYDTIIDDDAQAAFDADPSRTQYVVDGQFYAKDLSTKDEDQYVDHEVITFLKNKGNVLDAMGLGRQTKLLNEYLIDESDPAQGEVIGVSGLNPPYRLDPFQNIVNVNFTPRVYVIVVANNGVFARTDDPGVTILETASTGTTNGGGEVSATLIECSAAAGDGFLTLQTSPALDTVEIIFCAVFPHIDEIEAGWLTIARSMAKAEVPKAPFLWVLDELFVGGATLFRFKIRYAKHLNEPAPGVKNRMVQMYPMTGTNRFGLGNSNFMAGWVVGSYRTDMAGTGPRYAAPPEWQIDTIDLGFPGSGLLFGKDPPLIDSDVPA